jgi:hypothetical protein
VGFLTEGIVAIASFEGGKGGDHWGRASGRFVVDRSTACPP